MTTKLPLNHIWTIICTNSAVDIDSNNVSLFDLIEKVTLAVPKSEFDKAHQQGAKGIVFPIPFEIVTRFRRENSIVADAADVRFRLLNQKGEEVLAGEQKVALKVGVENLRVRNKINGLPVDAAGVYWVLTEVKSVDNEHFTEVNRLPLEIALKENE